MTTRSPLRSAAPAHFAVHLAVLMRNQDMTLKDLAEKSGVGMAGTGIAGTGIALRPSAIRCISLDTAERLAVAVGGDLAAMLRPFDCGHCRGEVPAGFTCNECGTKGGTS